MVKQDHIFRKMAANKQQNWSTWTTNESYRSTISTGCPHTILFTQLCSKWQNMITMSHVYNKLSVIENIKRTVIFLMQLVGKISYTCVCEKTCQNGIFANSG